VERHRALSADDSAAVPAPLRDADMAADVSRGSMPAESAPPVERSAAVSTTVRASVEDGYVVVVSETYGRDIDGHDSQLAELSSSQPSAGEQTAPPAAIDHDSHVAVARQSSASEDRQHADTNDAPAADADHAPPATIREADRQGPDAAVPSEAAPQSEVERQADEADASARPTDRLQADSMQRATQPEPPRRVASASEQPTRHEDSASAVATEPVAAGQQRTDDGADSELVSGDDAPSEPAAPGSGAAAEPPLPALDEHFPPSEQAAVGGAAAPPPAAPSESVTELPVVSGDQAANVDQTDTLGEPAELAPAGEPLSGVDDAPVTDAYQRQPPAPESSSLDGTAEPDQDTSPRSHAGTDTAASEAADAVSPQQQDVTYPVGTAAVAQDSTSAMSAEEPTEEAAVRQYVQVPDHAKCHACTLHAVNAPNTFLTWVPHLTLDVYSMSYATVCAWCTAGIMVLMLRCEVLRQDTVMGAGDVALELPAADIDHPPEHSLPAPAAGADATAGASRDNGGAALQAAPVSPADGLESVAQPLGDDEDTTSRGDTVMTSTELDREHSGWFETRGSAGTDVLAGDVVPAELLAPYKPLAAAAETQPAAEPQTAGVPAPVPKEAPLPVAAVEHRLAEAPSPVRDELLATAAQSQPAEVPAPVPEEMPLLAAAAEDRPAEAPTPTRDEPLAAATESRVAEAPAPVSEEPPLLPSAAEDRPAELPSPARDEPLAAAAESQPAGAPVPVPEVMPLLAAAAEDQPAEAPEPGAPKTPQLPIDAESRPAELLAPFDPLAAASETHPAEAPAPVPEEGLLLVPAAEDRSADAPSPVRDEPLAAAAETQPAEAQEPIPPVEAPLLASAAADRPAEETSPVRGEPLAAAAEIQPAEAPEPGAPETPQLPIDAESRPAELLGPCGVQVRTERSFSPMPVVDRLTRRTSPGANAAAPSLSRQAASRKTAAHAGTAGPRRALATEFGTCDCRRESFAWFRCQRRYQGRRPRLDVSCHLADRPLWLRHAVVQTCRAVCEALGSQVRA